jgi:hypothetical protein
MPPKKKGKKGKGGKKGKKVAIPEGVDAANVVSDYKLLCTALNVDLIDDIGQVMQTHGHHSMCVGRNTHSKQLSGPGC